MNKKDILKDFLAENKDSFDEFEPSSDVLKKIQSQLKLEEKQSRGKIISFRYWWAAAVLVLIIATVAIFQTNKTGIAPIAITGKPAINSHSLKPSIDSNGMQPSANTLVETKDIKNSIGKKKIEVRFPIKKDIVQVTDTMHRVLASRNIATMDWHKDLADSNSSSVRLAAVLASEKQQDLSISDMEMLAHTMNNDESSNVRLAALEVLGKQKDQVEVKNLIIASVDKQDDPIVQMELLSMLSPDEATSVKKQLVDITQNPMSIDAVRNQAYAALLRSKTNF